MICGNCNSPEVKWNAALTHTACGRCGSVDAHVVEAEDDLCATCGSELGVHGCAECDVDEGDHVEEPWHPDE